MFRDIVGYIGGTTNVAGGHIDHLGVWTALLFLATILLWWVARRQLGGISKTTKADFIHKFSNEFFGDTTRDILLLFNYEALHFKISQIEYGEDVPSKSFPYFLIDGKLVEQMKLDPDKKKKLLERKYYTSFEIDDYLLGYFEDIGSFEKQGLLDIKDVYNRFDWYIEEFWDNTEIKKYIDQQRQDEKNGDDIYEDFEYIFNKCVSFEKSKNKKEPQFLWRWKWWLLKK